MDNGASATLTLVATVDAGIGGTTITNTVTNTQDQTDDNTTPDDDTEDIIINDTEFLIPEGFSPGDGQFNEMFVIDGLEQFDQVSLKIYNRWGNLVYTDDNYENDWTGTTNVNMTLGGDLPSGTYYYLVEIKDNGKVYNGYVYLKRMNK